MAMNPWMTALQAALGGASGALAGYGQQRERTRIEQEAEAERKRQQMADTLSILNAGGIERGARQQAVTQAAPAAFDTAQNALSMMRGGPVTPVNTSSLQSAAGQFGAPAASFDVGGKTFDIMQTPLQRSMMLAEQESQRTKQAEADKRSTLKAEQDSLVSLAMDAVKSGPKSPAAARLAATNPSAYKALMEDPNALTAYQREQLALDKRRLALAESRGTGTAPAASSQSVLPSVLDAAKRLNKMTPADVKRMSAAGVMLANKIQQEGSWVGMGAGSAANAFGLLGDAENEYVQLGGSIADAVARVSEVGVLTNFDINRFRNQVLFLSGDSDVIKQQKANRLKDWANWLATNKGAIDAGNLSGVTKTPDNLAKLSTAGGGQSEQNRFDQRVQRGQDSAGALDAVQKETAASTIPGFTTQPSAQSAFQKAKAKVYGGSK